MLPLGGGKEKSGPSDGKPWTWQAIHALAAIGRVASPDDYTLRELLWRAEGLDKCEWNRTARLSFLFARGMLKGKFQEADFSPYTATPPANTGPMPENLPETLTETEIMARWAAVKDKVHG